MADLHEATFTWPDTGARDVILTGTYDGWCSSAHMTKGTSGFTGKISIPWGEVIEYKFIVDGSWMICDEQPTVLDWSGENFNHIYQAPPKPEPATNGVASTLPEAAPNIVTEVQATIGEPVAETTERETPTTTVPETLKTAGDSVVAQKGTWSTFRTSGICAAIKTFLGVDPINQDKDGAAIPDSIIRLVLKLWWWLQFAIIIFAFVCTMAMRGPQSVLGDSRAERRRSRQL